MKKILYLVFVSYFGISIAEVFYLPEKVSMWAGFERDNAKRKSSYPYITGDTFRAFCDHVFDEVKTHLDTDLIQCGDTIFLVADVLPYFFTAIYPQIKDPFIIVTHNRDASLPGQFASYLNDEKIIAWFTVNLDQEHPKLHALPIGIANSYWRHGDQSVLSAVSGKKADKTILLCASYVLQTHASRKEIYNHFSNTFFCYFAPKKPFADYLYDLRQAKFVLSPRGNGIDCHRTWEALLMGAVPIVPSTSINSVYDDLPVIIIEDWSTVTQKMLEETWVTFEKMSFKKEKIYADFWFDLISSYAKNAKAKNYFEMT